MPSKRSIFVQFGPQSVKQRCSASVDAYAQLGVADRRVGEFGLLFEIMNQLDLLKVAFVGHMESGMRVDEMECDAFGEFDEDILDAVLKGLCLFSPSFAQRCFWRALLAGQVSIGIWQDLSGCFIPLASFSDITDGSILIIAAPTSEDLPVFSSNDTIDEEYTQRVLDEVFDTDPSNIMDCALALMRVSQKDRLDHAGVQALLRDQFEGLPNSDWKWPFPCLKEKTADTECKVTYLADSLPTASCSAGATRTYPRRAPPQSALIPVYSSQNAPPLRQPTVDADAEFLSLFEECGRLTLGELAGPNIFGETAAASLSNTEVNLSPLVSLYTRVVKSTAVLSFLERHFPFIDHGDGKGFARVLGDSFMRPLRDVTGRIVVELEDDSAKCVVSSNVKEKPSINLKASTSAELGSDVFTSTAYQRVIRTEAVRLAVQRVKRRQPPPFPFLTEYEFKTLVSKIEAM